MDEAHARILRNGSGGVLLITLLIVIAALLLTPPASPLPHITPDPSLAGSPPVMVAHTFPYGGANVTITVPVSVPVYAGATRVERKAVNLHNTTDIEGRIYRAMINDPVQEDLYRDILSRLRAVRAEQGLTDDQYLDLVATYVQSMHYAVSDAPARYPVETVMKGGGDCDDKSLLLAALLAREDYPAALFLFRPEEHMAVGVGSDVLLYRTTGYAYIETTDISVPGFPPALLRGNVTLNSDPVVLPVSAGSKRYSAGNRT